MSENCPKSSMNSVNSSYLSHNHIPVPLPYRQSNIAPANTKGVSLVHISEDAAALN